MKEDGGVGGAGVGFHKEGKSIFQRFSVMKFFEHNITYCKLIN